MNDPDALNVWSEDRLVAFLWRDQASPQGTGFRYERDWIENGGFAISQTLPLKPEEFPVQAGALCNSFSPTCCLKVVQESGSCVT